MLPGDPWDPRLRGRSNTASSTDSLDSILAQFEVVQTSPEPPPRQPQSPGGTLLNAILQHSPLSRLQGRPPRPELNVTSAPYRPQHRRRRASAQGDQGYQSQLLLPVSGSPPPSSPQSRSIQDLRPLPAAARLAVNLTEDSPAVAASPVLAEATYTWRESSHNEGRLSNIPSLQSFDTISSSASVTPPESGTPRWGQAPPEDLFPLNLPLPPFHRPASPVTSERVPPPGGLGDAVPEREPAIAISPFAAYSSQPGLDLSPAASQSHDDPPPEIPSSHRIPGDAAVELAGSGDSGSESLTPKSEESAPTSASDYGSVAGADVGGERLNPGGEALKAFGPEATWNIPPSMFSGTVGKQPRPQLRKRDFESELLERLLSSSAKGQYMSPSRDAAAPRGVWRTFGLPRIVFVSTVFLCLLLFLAVFSAGRVHAQRSVRLETAEPTIELIALSQAAAAAAAAGPLHLPAPLITGDGKHRHGGVVPLDMKHVHVHLDAPLEEARTEDGKRRTRHSGQIPEVEGGSIRHKPGLRLLLGEGPQTAVRTGCGSIF